MVSAGLADGQLLECVVELAGRSCCLGGHTADGRGVITDAILGAPEGGLDCVGQTSLLAVRGREPNTDTGTLLGPFRHLRHEVFVCGVELHHVWWSVVLNEASPPS